MMQAYELDSDLQIANSIADSVPLYFDIKGRQLRVTEVFPYKDHLELKLNHPIEVVRRIYQRFGLDYHPAHEAAIRRFMAQNPQHKHGKHGYSLEQWGLTESDLGGLMREASFPP